MQKSKKWLLPLHLLTYPLSKEQTSRRKKCSEEKEVDGVLHSLPSRAGDGKWKMQKMIMQQKQKCFELETAQGTFLNGRYQEVCDLY